MDMLVLEEVQVLDVARQSWTADFDSPSAVTEVLRAELWARQVTTRRSLCQRLVPNRSIGEHIADELAAHGIPARFFPGRALDLHAEAVKVLTLHSAKGLEFPIVVLCGFAPGTYPEADDFEDREVYLERMRNERRLLYVGMSRAMCGLMVIRNAACSHETLHGLVADHWHVEEV